jgi:hypothetical protein
MVEYGIIAGLQGFLVQLSNVARSTLGSGWGMLGIGVLAVALAWVIFRR